MVHEHGAHQPQEPPQHGASGVNEQAQADHAATDHSRQDDVAIGHRGMDHAGMTSTVTGPQLAAVSVLTILALVGAFVFGIARYNLTLSNHDVGGLVMPPGMIMDRETSAESMRDMAAVDPRHVAHVAPHNARGDQLLEPR